MKGIIYFHRRTFIYHQARSETLVLSQKNTTFTTPRVKAELGITKNTYASLLSHKVSPSSRQSQD